jgi:hypothetical protein
MSRPISLSLLCAAVLIASAIQAKAEVNGYSYLYYQTPQFYVALPSIWSGREPDDPYISKAQVFRNSNDFVNQMGWIRQYVGKHPDYAWLSPSNDLYAMTGHTKWSYEGGHGGFFHDWNHRWCPSQFGVADWAYGTDKATYGGRRFLPWEMQSWVWDENLNGSEPEDGIDFGYESTAEGEYLYYWTYNVGDYMDGPVIQFGLTAGSDRPMVSQQVWNDTNQLNNIGGIAARQVLNEPGKIPTGNYRFTYEVRAKIQMSWDNGGAPNPKATWGINGGYYMGVLLGHSMIASYAHSLMLLDETHLAWYQLDTDHLPDGSTYATHPGGGQIIVDLSQWGIDLGDDFCTYRFVSKAVATAQDVVNNPNLVEGVVYGDWYINGYLILQDIPTGFAQLPPDGDTDLYNMRHNHPYWNRYLWLFDSPYNMGFVPTGARRDTWIDYVRIDTTGAYAPDPLACGQEGVTLLDTDLNGDCTVNGQDLLSFAADWLECTNPADPSCQQPPWIYENFSDTAWNSLGLDDAPMWAGETNGWSVQRSGATIGHVYSASDNPVLAASLEGKYSGGVSVGSSGISRDIGQQTAGSIAFSYWSGNAPDGGSKLQLRALDNTLVELICGADSNGYAAIKAKVGATEYVIVDSSDALLATADISDIPIKDSNDFVYVQYEGGTITNPLEWTDGNTGSEYNGTSTVKSSDGNIMNLYNLTTGEMGFYRYFTGESWPNMSIAGNGFTVEWKLKINSLSPSSNGWYLGLRDGARDWWAYLKASDQLYSAGQYYSVDISQWHTYRLTILVDSGGTAKANWYVDGNLAIAQITATPNTEQLLWSGVGWDYAYANVDYDYVRLTDGAYAPVSAPATAAKAIQVGFNFDLAGISNIDVRNDTENWNHADIDSVNFASAAVFIDEVRFRAEGDMTEQDTVKTLYFGRDHGIRIDIPKSICTDTGVAYFDTDFNQDCRVSWKDFTSLAADWLESTHPANP